MSIRAEACPEGVLLPLHWPLAGDSTSLLPVVRATTTAAAAPPVLLLVNRSRPIDPERRQQLVGSLSSSEHQRLEAYRRPGDRDRFLLGRGALRLLLSQWLAMPPEAVPIENSPHGKPYCPGAPQFNLSHSGDLILLALHPQRSVGVDVERLRPELDWQPIALRMFSESARRDLAARPETERHEAFLAAWCRLEARLKAHGRGLKGLERLREQERQANAAVSGRTATGVLSDADQHSSEDPTAVEEQLWDVAVPSGYRAAAALAPAEELRVQAGPDRAADRPSPRA